MAQAIKLSLLLPLLLLSSSSPLPLLSCCGCWTLPPKVALTARAPSVRHRNSTSNSSATRRQSSLLLCRCHRRCRCCLGGIATSHVVSGMGGLSIALCFTQNERSTRHRLLRLVISAILWCCVGTSCHFQMMSIATKWSPAAPRSSHCDAHTHLRQNTSTRIITLEQER